MSEMLTQIRTLGDQLRWASEREDPRIGTHSEILFAGMGGSGIVGDYVGALAAPHGARVSVHKGYGPVPLWAVRQRPLVLAVSYSGNTEETISFARAAHESGLPVATVTTGGTLGEMSTRHSWPSIQVPSGLQPRAALGYGVGAAIKLLEASHSIDDQRLSFVESFNFVDQALEETSSQWAQAREIADGLGGRIPIVYGGGRISSVVAQRWKTQVNENAKRPAWYSVLPELDHNEIVGWEGMRDLTSEHFGVVALTDPDDHDRVVRRLAHTRELTEDSVPWVGRVASNGTSALTRLMSLTVVGDLVSWLLAEAAGVDPVPVATIEDLKKLLNEEDQ